MDKKYRSLHTTNPHNPDDPEGIHQYYLKIIRAMPNNVYWLDANCITQGCNDNVLKLVNLEKLDDFIGITYEEMARLANWTEGQAESFKRDDMEVIATGKPKINMEEPPVYDAEGNPRYYISTRVPLFSQDRKVIGVVGISVDITEMKQKEEELSAEKEKAEVANKAKTEFLENMRHDLRTPLTGIVGFAQAIQAETTDPTVKEYADNLVASSEALLNILNEILDTVRLASGKTPIHKKKFHLQEKLRSVVYLNQAKASEKKLNLVLEYDPDIPEYFVGDDKRIQRVVLELLANALKFTQEGEVKIIAHLEKQDGKQAVIKLDITDTGIGIPENKREAIFGSFNRLHDAYQGIFQGIGLGLTIAQQFIEDLGGEIYVHSLEGKGSEFTCIFPLQIALMQDDSQVEKTTDTLVLREASFVGKNTLLKHTAISENSTVAAKILLVEDNDLAAKVAVSLLERLGCQVDVAENGSTAIEMVKTCTYSLIFMDVGMPGIDGNEATKTIRDWENQFDWHTPIIGLTAHVEAEDKQKCIQAGMDAVLSKPLKPEMAKDLLDAFLPKHTTNEAAEKSPKTIFSTFGLPEQEEAFFTLPEKYIDFDRLSQISKDTQAWAKEVLPDMAKEIEKEAEKIQEAYRGENWQSVQDLVHKLRGGLSYCGTVRLEQACAYLEGYLKAKETKLIEALYQQLLKEMIDTKKAIYVWMEG